VDESGRYVLALHLISGIGAVTYRRLMSKFGTPEAVLKAPAEHLLNLPFLGETRASVIERGRAAALDKADEEILRAKKEGVEIIAYTEGHYPAPLRSIYDPPLVVYMRGKYAEEDAIAIGMVGTRRPSVYGQEAAERLAVQLVGRGFAVVSGLAQGIDTSAHKGALKGGGRTIAVFGSGLDIVYPKENEKLASAIAERGALITELPFGTTPSKESFPRRNRLISGLSLGVVVVEGKENSGALITARFASEQGREVFAVPGKIDDPRSRGPHLLIKQGAKLIEGVEDILEELGPVADFMKPSSQDTKDDEPENNAENVKENATASKKESPKGQKKTTGKPLTSPERAILALLSEDPLPVDEIIAETGLTPAEVASHLMVLEIRRLVRQLPGKQFVREAKSGEET
jgi:DNA processing protein